MELPRRARRRLRRTPEISPRCSASAGFIPPTPAFAAPLRQFAASSRRRRRRRSSRSSSPTACSSPATAARRREIVVVYDRADKVLEIDTHSLMAIAGVPATAWEMARVLEHSFQFYRRSQLQEMSLDGKVRALSKLLRDNLGFVMQGVGVVVPIFATYDTRGRRCAALFLRRDGRAIRGRRLRRHRLRLARGAQRPALRKHLGHQAARQTQAKRTPSLLALRALDTAAETDTATGGVDRRGRVYPIVKIITRAGITHAAGEAARRGSRFKRTHTSHDRRAVPLGRSDRQPARIHRAPARRRQPDRRAQLSRWHPAFHPRPRAAEALRNLRSHRHGRHRPSRRHRAPAHGGDRGHEHGGLRPLGARCLAAPARELLAQPGAQGRLRAGLRPALSRAPALRRTRPRRRAESAFSGSTTTARSTRMAAPSAARSRNSASSPARRRRPRRWSNFSATRHCPRRPLDDALGHRRSTPGPSAISTLGDGAARRPAFRRARSPRIAPSNSPPRPSKPRCSNAQPAPDHLARLCATQKSGSGSSEPERIAIQTS